MYIEEFSLKWNGLYKLEDLIYLDWSIYNISVISVILDI